MAIKLYSMVPQDCSGKVRWLLLEMGLEFEDIRLSWKNGDLKTPEYLAKHPIGQVPVLEDGEVTIFESYAMVTYLADKYIEKKLAPAPENSAARANYYQWMFFSTNTAESFFTRYLKLPETTDEYRNQWGSYIQEKVQMVLGTIEGELKGQEYILGSFSAVDTCLGCAIDSIAEENLLGDFPRVVSYYERLTQRKACQDSKIFERG